MVLGRGPRLHGTPRRKNQRFAREGAGQPHEQPWSVVHRVCQTLLRRFFGQRRAACRAFQVCHNSVMGVGRRMLPQFRSQNENCWTATESWLAPIRTLNVPCVRLHGRTGSRASRRLGKRLFYWPVQSPRDAAPTNPYATQPLKLMTLSSSLQAKLDFSASSRSVALSAVKRWT
jgi:hypothetical protein